MRRADLFVPCWSGGSCLKVGPCAGDEFLLIWDYFQFSILFPDVLLKYWCKSSPLGLFPCLLALSVYLPTNLSIYLSVCLSVCLSILYSPPSARNCAFPVRRFSPFSRTLFNHSVKFCEGWIKVDCFIWVIVRRCSFSYVASSVWISFASWNEKQL